MNGAIAELPPITIKIPNKGNTIMMGANHHFFSFKKNRKSVKRSMINNNAYLFSEISA